MPPTSIHSSPRSCASFPNAQENARVLPSGDQAGSDASDSSSALTDWRPSLIDLVLVGAVGIHHVHLVGPVGELAVEGDLLPVG